MKYDNNKQQILPWKNTLKLRLLRKGKLFNSKHSRCNVLDQILISHCPFDSPYDYKR